MQRQSLAFIRQCSSMQSCLADVLCSGQPAIAFSLLPALLLATGVTGEARGEKQNT